MPEFDPCRAANSKLAEIKRAMLMSVQEDYENSILDSLKDCHLFYWTTR